MSADRAWTRVEEAALGCAADLGSFAVKSWKLFAGDFSQIARDVFSVSSAWLVRSPAK
jgi:hypothetical protein